jgi:tetratricopeptide (TPR) repeat protein
LNRTEDGANLWQAQYDGNLKDILGIDHEVAEAIAGALRLPLTEAHAEESDPGAEAFDEYLHGIEQEQIASPDALRMAEQHYRNAIRIAPRYARAFARLASVSIARASWTGPDQKTELENARRALETALSFDPKLAMAHAGLARVDYILNWDWSRAEAGFRRALDLAPSSTARGRS